MAYRRRVNRRRRHQRRVKAVVVQRRPRRKKMMKSSILKVPGLNLADRAFVTLPFTQSFVYAIGGATGATGPAFFRSFSGTNIMDPGYTGSALSVAGFTQWSSMYNKFKVYASSINVKFMSSGDPTLPSAMRCFVIPLSAVGTLGSSLTFDEAISQKYVRWKVYNATTNFPTIRSRIGTAKMAGVARESVRDEATTYTGVIRPFAQAPPNEYFWAIGVSPVAVNAEQQVNVLVRLTYNIEFYDRVPFEQV